MLERLSAAPARVEGAIGHYDWDELVQEDRVHRLIYTDPAIFAAEMTHIFGAVWVYLGHESQIPSNDDFITVRMGLRPLSFGAPNASSGFRWELEGAGDAIT